MHEHVSEVGDHVGVVLALAGDDADAGLGAGLLFELAHPEAEAGEIGGDGGNAVGGGFMGSVAPGLVPGEESLNLLLWEILPIFVGVLQAFVRVRAHTSARQRADK